MKKQYKIIKISKGNGNFRTIYAPSKAYKTKLKSFLLDLQQKVHNADSDKIIHGFLRGRGPVSNAQKHMGYNYTLSLDLKDFFDSVKVEMVQEYISEEEQSFCFIDGIARQGLPTSPLMANLAFLKLDKAIKETIAEEGAYTVYTRYADDLIFSFNNLEFAETLERVVTKIVTDGGFVLNNSKRKLQSAKNGRRIITGIAVDKREIYPTRKLKRRIRAALHQENRAKAFGLLSWAECKEPKAFYTDRDLLNKNIFQDEAIDLSNDFYLSDLLSFEEYVALVEDDFEGTKIAHEHDTTKWSKQKASFLEQREAFYIKEKERAVLKRQKTREKIEQKLHAPEKRVEKKEAKKSVKPSIRSKVAPFEETIKVEEKHKELTVDFDTLKEIEQERAEQFQKVRKERRHNKEVKELQHEQEEEKKRSLNKIFTASLLPIVLLIAAMSYYFSSTEVEIKPTYPLFVNVTPYDARIQILNIKPKYKIGIELKPGKYDILISKKGYKKERFWVTMEHEPVIVERELKKIKKRKVY